MRRSPDDPGDVDAALRKLARACVGDASVADDVVQETWLRGLARRRGERGWLRNATRLVASETLRGERRRRHREQAAAREEVAPSPVEAAAVAEAAQALREAVATLPEPLREPLRLRFYEDLPFAEIGERLGRPESTVKAQVYEGLARLRRRLDRRYGGRESWAVVLGGWARSRSEAGAAAKAPLLGAWAPWVVAAAVVLPPLALLGWRLARPAPAAPAELVAVETPAAPGAEGLDAVAAGDGGSPAASRDARTPVAPAEPAASAPEDLPGAAAAAPAEEPEPETAGTLRVRATRPGGAPVGGATVVLLEEDETETVVGRTGVDGWLEVAVEPRLVRASPNASGERPSVGVRGDEHALQGYLLPVWEPGVGATLEVELDPALPPIEGTVASVGGTPLPDATLLLHGGDSWLPLEDGTILRHAPRRIPIDSDGRFRFEGVAMAGSSRFSVDAPGHLRDHFAIDPDARNWNSVDLRLRPARVVRGVARTEDGSPVAGAQIEYELPWPPAVRAVTDAEGAYELTLFVDGALQLWARHPADAALVDDRVVDAAPGAAVRWDPVLLDRPDLNVVVVDVEDRPVAGARVVVRRHPGQAFSDEPVDRMSRYLVDGRTDAEGRVAFHRVDARAFRIGAFPLAFDAHVPCATLAPAVPREEPYVLRLPDLSAGPVTLRGMLVGDVGQIEVDVASPEHELRMLADFDRATGELRQGNLPPGEYWIAGLALGEGQFAVGPFRVDAGETLDVGAHPVPAKGRVGFTERPSEPNHLEVLTVSDRERGLSKQTAAVLPPQTDAVSLFPGDYTVAVWTPDGSAPRYRFRVLSGETSVVEVGPDPTFHSVLRVEGAAPVRVRVVDAAGATVVDDEAAVGAGGTAEVAVRLRAGAYEAVAEAADGRSGRIAFRVGPDEENPPVRMLALD